ncbi:MAG: hypothetical protein KKB85_02475, partial [Candidatus Altiarchaeota archaeon]|nr:hypothetical protein [Candidatus Altiarchaeota archaeon]
MALDEKIKEIEEEIQNTSYNKATQHHIGKLKAKLANLKEESIKRASGKGSGLGFGVKKSGDPRYVLKKNLKKIKDMGFTYYIGPELEYFYFENPKNTIILDRGGYFDLTPLDVAQDLRRETVVMLEKMGVQVEYSHHEVATSQHEIDLRYCDALTMADNVMTYRMVVKEVARQHGKYATFMPKPIYGINGSGMHVHQSLFKGSKNAFFSKTDRSHLSDTAKYFIAGILKHVNEITAVTNQWVNSYKRLIPGYEAPVYICWAQMNRSALVRVPMYKPGIVY